MLKKGKRDHLQKKREFSVVYCIEEYVKPAMRNRISVVAYKNMEKLSLLQWKTFIVSSFYKGNATDKLSHDTFGCRFPLEHEFKL